MSGIKEDTKNKHDPRKGIHFIFPQRGRGIACQTFELVASQIMNRNKLILTMFSITLGNLMPMSLKFFC